MCSNFVLNEISEVLDTYKGRDKFLRTLCYCAKLIGGLSKNDPFVKKMNTFSSQMSAARGVLRLLDDLPMLQYTLEYGFGKQEPDKFMALLGVTTNVIDQLYYPIEKVAWLAEHKLISGVNQDKWDTASSVFWVLSIYLTLIKTLRYVSILQQHKGCISKDKSALDELLRRQKNEMVTCVRMALDFVHAVNTLPPGFLWSAKLEQWQVGVIATASSFLGLYQIFAKRRSS